MNPPDLWTGFVTFLSLFAITYIVSWQLRLRPQDKQQWAATIFVAATLLIVAQLCFAYLGGPIMGNSYRGQVSWSLWCLSAAWWAWETRRVNVRALDERGRRGEMYIGSGLLLLLVVIILLVWLF